MADMEFESIKIGLASPDQIRTWSSGEVTKPETINYRTLKPERDGLFCEKIFGPTKDWECHCGKYKRIRYKGKVCERCGVEVTRAKVRRERMGTIELASPVSHIWYYKTIPSRMGLVLDVAPRVLEQVLYFSSYIVTDPGDTPLEKKQLLNETQYRDMREKYDEDFKAGMGAEAIKTLLEEIDLDKLSEELKAEAETATGAKRAKLFKRLEIVEAFRQSGNRPEWMILDVIPVIPPDLRPMVQLDGGRFATSDLNDLYRRVINRNNRLKRLLELGAPDIIVRNEKRMLQEAVDALIDNGRRGRPVTGPSNRALKSLSDMLKGKQGRFRQNLLGKRVDYSGRSVIVVGPELKMYQCGLPKEMALELFKPFVMKRLVETGGASNIKTARKMVDRVRPEVWDALGTVIKEHPVLLNRAPTLHRLGIQAFEPVLVEGRAIKLHPLVCTAYNADFDGDQMAVHVPLSAEAQAEARFLMLAANNLLKPSDGKPVAVPTQDMVLGSYYLTLTKFDEPGVGKIFRSEDEAIMAYESGVIGLHSPIRVRRTGEWNGETITRMIDATVGFFIFNRSIPQDLGFAKRTEGHELDLEICFTRKNEDKVTIESEDDIKQNKVGKKTLGKIIDACIKKHGTSETAIVLDNVKSTGYKYSTKGAITVSVSDAIIPPKKAEYIAESEKEIEEITKKFNRGLASEADKKRLVIESWNRTTEKVADALKDNLDEYNPIFMMADSGARGSMNQIRQLAGMRGLIANTSGEIIEVPIRANYREGLNILEYFISSRGARKGLADTALRTADSGYLTRRLVDVSQDVIVREDDCETDDGLTIYAIYDRPIEVYKNAERSEMEKARLDGKTLTLDEREELLARLGKPIEPLSERLTGRFLLNDCVDNSTGEVVMAAGEMLSEEDAVKVYETERKNQDTIYPCVEIRSILGCHAKHGVCKKCYGANLANGKTVTVGEAVGIIAAQSIGEPGTQLTMRTFHTGGIANAEDITQGLPRVEELFEARRPKRAAFISGIDGTVSIRDGKRNKEIYVIAEDASDERKYVIPYDYTIKVEDGVKVKAGDPLTEGVYAPQDILESFLQNGNKAGELAVRTYIIEEVQRTYRSQGVDINDKHIEVIVRQMMKKLLVEDAGSTSFINNTQVDRGDFFAEKKAIKERIAAGEEGLLVPTARPTLLGITKASLATDSFLSAASFQETTRVLTDAAIRGKVDNLFGLKENVIIGKLVPAGTGMKMNGVDVDSENYDILPEEDYVLEPESEETVSAE
ncbi:MAG: DNA-directed RNA polymerase subunit beta' [Acutalibacteraceae bacterium]|nr:DNA-directed RNA polymerase subunit beta' [Acutalibacteraceae bacterium]